MKEILLVVHILAAVGVIGLVLLQQGKGADMGAAFGSGASATLFGARGSATFLSRLTAVLAAVFLATSLSLAVLYAKKSKPQSVVDQPAAVTDVPAAPAAPADLPAVPK